MQEEDLGHLEGVKLSSDAVDVQQEAESDE
jgi:hypothetical protein